MLVTDGNVFFNSKDITAVGSYLDGGLVVYIRGIPGHIQLKFKSTEKACAVHMRLVLELVQKKEIKDITAFLLSNAEAKKLDVERVKKYFAEIIIQKGE